MQNKFHPFRFFYLVSVLSFALLLTLSAGCGNGDPRKTDSVAYREAVSSFYTGTIALQSGDKSGHAETELLKLTRTVPQEPAGWANLGLLQIRVNDLKSAAESLAKAEAEDPKKDPIATGQIAALRGLLAQQQGNFSDAVARYREASTLAPGNLRALYRIKSVVEQQRDPQADTTILDITGRILKVLPTNLEALIEQARVAARKGDAAITRTALQKIVAQSKNWQDAAKQQLQSVQKAAQGNDLRDVSVQLIGLRNTLKTLPAYRSAVDAISESESLPGTPLERLLVLPTPRATPAPPDNALTYNDAPLPTNDGKAAVAIAVPLDETTPAAVFIADGKTVRRVDKPEGKPLPFPGGAQNLAPTRNGILAIDLDNDIRADLVFAGAGGIRLLHQENNGTFADVTAKSKLPQSVLNGAYTGAWAVDIEADGDMDIVLGAKSGEPIVLRNNGDGSFVVQHPFPGVNGLRAFTWADMSGGGAPDAALVDSAGTLHYFENLRSGAFRPRPTPKSAKIASLTVADTDNDGLLDLVLLGEDGSVTALCDAGGGSAWKPVKKLLQSEARGQESAIYAADLDNNGSIDYVISDAKGSQIYLSDGTGNFAPPTNSLPRITVQAIADTDNDGTLDLIGVSGDKLVELRGKGTKKYHWQAITLIPNGRRMATSVNNQRINTFCIGGEIEVRSGLLYQKQPINSPQVHFGLGERDKVDVARIVWPTGNPQAEFDLKLNQVVAAEQRLGGSCPFLFAWDGTKMGFVTDCIWRSPLGLKINAQDTAGTIETEDWVKIRGDQLIPHDGYYDLRVTAELRETHFFDRLSLLTVDHPAGTDIFVDERFAFPQPPKKAFVMTPPKPFATVTDDNGNDVNEIVRNRDKIYLDTFGRGAYQGVTRDHFVEVTLGDDVPVGKPVYLVAFGWVHPTDSSINVAMGQNLHTAKPTGLSLETTDSKGGWHIAKRDLGFPEGKVKTILIRLDDAFQTGAPRKFRLRTNLEVFWDQLAWSVGLPESPMIVKQVPMQRAELGYRGFSVVRAKDSSSPELPQDYDRLSGTAPQWRDLEGYHTRYGDIRPLLEKTDDHYVIMSAGDEMRLRFPAHSEPRPGWQRDFVLIGDGWVKDGNVNTTFGKTVLPLPAHDIIHYDTRPTTLENDPVYRRHPEDWQRYHTRYIATDGFSRALKPLLAK